MTKLIFKFTDGKGAVHESIEDFADDKEYYARLQRAQISFYQGQAPRERKWRNSELQKTDYFTLTDATFKGEEIAGSDKQKEILAYRKALRAYNLMDDDRPTRPSWFDK